MELEGSPHVILRKQIFHCYRNFLSQMILPLGSRKPLQGRPPLCCSPLANLGQNGAANSAVQIKKKKKKMANDLIFSEPIFQILFKKKISSSALAAFLEGGNELARSELHLCVCGAGYPSWACSRASAQYLSRARGNHSLSSIFWT